MILLCLAVALHDVDGPIHCQSGEKIRLQGIGATEMNGTCRPGQPCVPGDPRAQRRTMATRAIGALVEREDRSELGQAWFARPVQLRCELTGKSHARLTAWCTRPDGADVSCEAIRAGVAARWERYDRGRRRLRCAARVAGYRGTSDGYADREDAGLAGRDEPRGTARLYRRRRDADEGVGAPGARAVHAPRPQREADRPARRPGRCTALPLGWSRRRAIEF